jgi:hypothetical protein
LDNSFFEALLLNVRCAQGQTLPVFTRIATGFIWGSKTTSLLSLRHRRTAPFVPRGTSASLQKSLGRPATSAFVPRGTKKIKQALQSHLNFRRPAPFAPRGTQIFHQSTFKIYRRANG